MPAKSPKPLLELFLRCCRRLKEKTSAVTQAQFLDDLDLFRVAERELEIAGQIAKDLDEKILAEIGPGLNWKGLKGLRDVLAHAYSSVRPEVIWHAASVDIDQFAKPVEEYLRKLP